jgi:hypothetical protein
MNADLGHISPDEWIRHFNERYYEGEWSGVALRAPAGALNKLYPDPTTHGSLVDTAALDRCPSIKVALSALQCPVKSARLLKLCRGARIIEHRDYNLSLEDGEIRLHVPIATSPLVEFYLNGERIVMKPGECWYINANLPHKVDNFSDTDRVHLVIDCMVDDWIRSLIDSSSEHRYCQDVQPRNAKDRPSSPKALSEFCNLVFEDAGLQESLRSVADNHLFVDLVVRLGEERGFSFNGEDVEVALRENRRVQFEKWL